MRQQGSVEDRIRHAFEGVDHPIPLEDVIASAEVQRRRRRGVVGLAAAGVLVTIFLVVVAFLPGSAPAYEWTREASSPDPEVVAGIPEWCTLPTDAGIGPLPPTVLVDQRGSAAAGLFTDEAQAWVCFVHFDGTNWTNDGNAGSGGPLCLR